MAVTATYFHGQIRLAWEQDVILTGGKTVYVYSETVASADPIAGTKGDVTLTELYSGDVYITNPSEEDTVRFEIQEMDTRKLVWYDYECPANAVLLVEDVYYETSIIRYNDTSGRCTVFAKKRD